jgi:hypothetical protein
MAKEKKDKLPKTVVEFPYQTGHRKSFIDDKNRRALYPGKRISITGHEYWETRMNRSDIKGTRL